MLDKQFGKKVEGENIEIISGMNSRSRRHKKFDGNCGANKNKASKSRRQCCRSRGVDMILACSINEGYWG